MYGHCDDVWAVALHPARPHRAATVSEKVLGLWDLAARSLERRAVVGFAARAVAFSSRPLEADGSTHHVAVGGSKGDLMVSNRERGISKMKAGSGIGMGRRQCLQRRH